MTPPRRPIKEAVESMKLDLIRDLRIVQDHLTKTGALDDPDIAHAFAGVATFCAIGVRLVAQTNLSKVRDIATTVEIQARLDGVEVL